MKIKFILLFLLQLLLITSTLAETKTITHIVVFGDSLSDRGFSKYGGFNRCQIRTKVISKKCVFKTNEDKRNINDTGARGEKNLKIKGSREAWPRFLNPV